MRSWIMYPNAPEIARIFRINSKTWGETGRMSHENRNDQRHWELKFICYTEPPMMAAGTWQLRQMWNQFLPQST